MTRSLASKTTLWGIFGTVLYTAASQAHASGYAIIEQGASGMGNAFAGAAAVAEDPTTIFFNPAGMMNVEQNYVLAAHIILPRSQFRNDNSTAFSGAAPLNGSDDDGGQTKVVPNLYAIVPINDSMRFGLGIFAPFGLATKYDDNWIGRYHAVESDLQSLNINPSIAYKTSDKLSFGLGFNVQFFEVTVSSALDLGTICTTVVGAGDPTPCIAQGIIPQQTDGFVKFTADNNSELGYGWNAGVLYQATPETRLGLAYRSEISETVKGKGDFSIPAQATLLTASGALVDTNVSADVTTPQSISFSVNHQHEKVTVLFDLTYTKWDVFKELRIKYANPVQADSVTDESWDNSWRISLGGKIALSEKWILRTGFALDETPIPDAAHRTPRVPDNTRKWLSLGASYSATSKINIDAGYSQLFINDVLIDNADDFGHTLNGYYNSSVGILSAQLRWLF